jgi:hypothetical protein
MSSSSQNWPPTVGLIESRAPPLSTDEPDQDRNPYAPPRAELVPPDEAIFADPAECERLRLPNLRTESRVRTVGLGWMLAAPVTICLFYLYTTDKDTVWPVFIAFMIVIGGIPTALGLGLRSYRGWARWGVILLSLPAAGLIGWLCWVGLLPTALDVLTVPPFCAGVVVLVSRSAAIVCRHSYRIAVRKTPHLRPPRRPMWTAALVELTLVVAVIVWRVFAGSFDIRP